MKAKRKSGESITFGQLRCFAIAAQLGSFVRAAEQLGIAQPTVSEQITRLEARLNCKLFLRRRGTTPILTIEGSRALEKTLEILQSGNELLDLVERPPFRPTIKICIGSHLRETCLKPLLPRLYRDHPNLSIEIVREVPMSEMAVAMDRGRVDLFIYTMGDEARHWPDITHVCDVPVVFIAPPGVSQQISTGEIALSELQFLLPGTREIIEPWCRSTFAQLGITPKKQPRFIEMPEIIPDMVAEGAGVSILMLEPIKHKIERGLIEAIDFNLPPMRRVVGRSRRAPAEAQFIEQQLIELMKSTLN